MVRQSAARTQPTTTHTTTPLPLFSSSRRGRRTKIAQACESDPTTYTHHRHTHTHTHSCVAAYHNQGPITILQGNLKAYSPSDDGGGNVRVKNKVGRSVRVPVVVDLQEPRGP